jgi:hypothetical protein
MLEEYLQTWTPNQGCNCGGERSVGRPMCVAPNGENPNPNLPKTKTPKKVNVKVRGPVKSSPPEVRDALERIRRGNTK